MVAWPLQLSVAVAAATLLLSVASPGVGGEIHGGGGSSSDVVSSTGSPDAVGATAGPSGVSTPATTTLSTTSSTLPLTRVHRLAIRDIQRFRSYKDISMLPFVVPERVRFASFNFTGTESVMSSIVRKCPPRKVTVALKFGSYPVINPDGAKYPDHYETQRLPYYQHEFDSDGKPQTINVTNPLPGEWYAVAFISFTDPNDDKIQQQGLSATCVALLEAVLDTSEQENVPELAEGIATPLRVDGTDAKALRRDFRIYVPQRTRVASVELLVSTCSRNRCPDMALLARSNAFPGISEPDGGNDTVRRTCPGSNIQRGDECILGIAPEEDSWLFITVEANPDAKSAGKETQVGYALNVTFEMETLGEDGECTASEGECWRRVQLMRQSYVALFMYNYVRPPDPSKPPSEQQNQGANVSTSAPTLFEFSVSPVKDVGGTLTFELRLDTTSALRNVTTDIFKVERSGDSSTSTTTTSTAAPSAAVVSNQLVNVSIVACLSYGYKRLPGFPDTCEDLSTRSKTSASVRVNTTSTTSYMGKVHVPFPEPGHWYLTVQPYCFTLANETETRVDCGEFNETQLSFVIDSEMCGSDSCGQWGHCNNYLSGGVIFATCVCQHGYRGWGCTDDERIDQLRELLLAALLLTLSNLPFLLSAFVAVRRGYYTEAFVYCCTLFFSTFYHACEAGEDVYSYCIMKLHVLQFCDFYSAILALWVTMIAMADLPNTPRSLAHMAGAVGIALGTEYDRTSLMVFMVPTLIGVALVSARWGMRCRAHRSCYPERNYWKFCVPPGAILVLVGIVCFSFLQTRSNYKYVHSAWHSMMALAIVFVLPSRHHRAFESVESDDSVDSATPFWKRTKRWFCEFPRCRCWS